MALARWPARTPVLVVDGLIGAGKSTALQAAAEALRARTCPTTGRPYRVAVVPEPVEKWREIGALPRFYADPRGRSALWFQTHAFCTRILALVEACRAEPDADAVLVERSIVTDRYVFVETLRSTLHPQELRMYEILWDMQVHVMPFDLTRACYVYLRPSLEACMRRTADRARPEEMGAPLVAAPGQASPASSSAPPSAATKDGGGADEAAKDGGGGAGVTAAYQAALQVAHDALFRPPTSPAGGVAAAPPDASAAAPPWHAAMCAVTVEGALVEDDYAAPGPARDRLAARLVALLEVHATRCADAPAGPSDGKRSH